ncbi:hypothetical protein K0B96_06685 [Horticoccus luteus]|uniref:Uncharacterized protein n=1 Tax=Horticoccus luteus TaxID=2862869 RepID=A0A8F9TWB4_9BACT|nr:hypothetical protein [Horticoccus luteus]QYM80296.1 hypothetical protein K0B96_06685 [Horticoccus luteus]
MHTDERRAALWREMQSWEGTPFFAHNASKGHGVDCVRLQMEIFAGAGAIARVPLPAYTLDHAKHTTRPQLLLWLLTAPELAGRLVMVSPAGRLMTGDLLGVNCGRVDHHLASVTPWGDAIHAVDPTGVIRTPLDDPKLRGRIVYALRLMEVAS